MDESMEEWEWGVKKRGVEEVIISYGPFPMLTKTKKTKIENLKFRQNLYHFGIDPPPPPSINEFLGMKLLCTFRGGVVLSFFQCLVQC